MTLHGWRELGDGVYLQAFEQWNLNVGLVVGDERAAVVDTRATPEQGRELRRTIRNLTDRQLVVINTHAHVDHCLGNVAFGEVEMLAHPAAVAAMRSRWADWLEEAGDADPDAHQDNSFVRPGEVAVPTEIDLGGRTVRVRHHGRGHTDGDLVVDVVGDDVAFAGDLVRQDRAPWFGDAHPLEWSATVTHMLALREGSMTWVPGHGAPMDEDDVLSQARVLDRVATVITDCWHDRLPASVAVAAVPLSGTNAERAVARGYRQLDGWLGGVSRAPG